MYFIKLILFKILRKLLILVQNQTIKYRNELNVRNNIKELTNFIKKRKGNYWTTNATRRRLAYL